MVGWLDTTFKLQSDFDDVFKCACVLLEDKLSFSLLTFSLFPSVLSSFRSVFFSYSFSSSSLNHTYIHIPITLIHVYSGLQNQNVWPLSGRAGNMPDWIGQHAEHEETKRKMEIQKDMNKKAANSRLLHQSLYIHRMWSECGGTTPKVGGVCYTHHTLTK